MSIDYPIAVTVAETDGESLTMTNSGAKVDGVDIRIQEWEGWTETADVRADPIDIPGYDGTYDDDPLFSSRTVILRGALRADSPTELKAIRDKMTRLLAGQIRRGTVQVGENGDTAQQCLIRLGGKTVVNLDTPTRAKFSMSLFAPSAKRTSVDVNTVTLSPYSPPAGMTFPWTFPWNFGAPGSDGRAAITNNGFADADIQMTVLGACVNPRMALVETNQDLAFLTSLGAGQSLSIDTAALPGSRVLLNGTSPWDWTRTTDSVFFKIPPGTWTLFFAVDSGTPTLTATWADTTP